MFKTFATEFEAQQWVAKNLNENLIGPNLTYFVGFRNADPDRPYGILYGCASWLSGQLRPIPYIKDIFPHVIH